MTTKVVRSTQHITSKSGGPVQKVLEQVKIMEFPQDQDRGRVLGRKPQSEDSAGPRANILIGGLKPKTPKLESRVLPWIDEVRDAAARGERDSTLDADLGPYDSRPATRPTSILDTAQPPLPKSNIHPFARTAAATTPFSALAGPTAVDMGGMEYIADQGRPARPESEVLSRGAGVRILDRPKDAVPGGRFVGVGMDQSPGTNDSLGMGTFGREGSQAPYVQTSSPLKQPLNNSGFGHPPEEPLPPNPVPMSANETPHKSKSVSPPEPVIPPQPHDYLQETQFPPHIHRPHHDFPFNPIEAFAKQTAAMEYARAQALAQLEAGHEGQAENKGDVKASKGQRQTFETVTSDPSFGHLLHQDGMPVSRHMSMQPPIQQVPPMNVPPIPIPRDIAGMSGGAFFKIPFGVPAGMKIPRPLLVMRDTLGLGTGLAIPMAGDGARAQDSPESTVRQGKIVTRSAYVESVEDEEEPVGQAPETPPRSRLAKSAVRSGLSRDAGSPAQMVDEPVKVASARAPSRVPTHQPARESTPPPDFAPPRPQSYAVPPPRSAHTHTRERSTAPSPMPAQINTHQPILEQVYHVQHSRPMSHHPTKTHSVASTVQTQGTVRAPSPPVTAVPSLVPTTHTNIKHMVRESKFHDETLCQLLDAARLNLVGGEAKKALQRAARARVIELRDMRENGQLPEDEVIIEASKRDKRGKSKERGHRGKGSGESKLSKKQERVEPTTPPQWADALLQRIAAFDDRVRALEQREAEPDHASEHPMTAPSRNIPSELINELLFNDLPTSGFTTGRPDAPVGFPSFPFAMGFPDPTMGMYEPPNQGAYIRTLSPSVQPRDRDDLTWGSEVELPQPGDNVSPPKPSAPTIHIQAPTESNLEKSQRAFTNRSERTARRVDIQIIDQGIEEEVELPTALPEPFERDLPPTPSESVRSHRPSPAPTNPDLPIRAAGRAPTVATMQMPPKEPTMYETQTIYKTTYEQIPKSRDQHATASTSNDGPGSGTVYKTAYGFQALAPIEPLGRPLSTHEETMRIYDDAMGQDDTAEVVLGPQPWDRVMQRLFSWAVVWEEGMFTRAMEDISLNKQVEEFALTVFVMMTFKRMIKKNLTESPIKTCDKMFIPPNMSDSINKAVHAKNLGFAKQMLEELWQPFDLSEAPRIIIALSRHRNESDSWAAHRFDLSTGHMTSYNITTEENLLHDGRPFMWWHAIKLAWPKYDIPDPDSLRQRSETVRMPLERRNDCSLQAANYARNLFLGFRPEHRSDLVKLRETVWHEVKRLLHKKRAGDLLVSSSSQE